jgi:predicted O-methyltransferase YrrM
MTRGGVLTSLEPDPETYRLATTAFKEVAGSRVRSIHGDVSTLLERLADASYDLVLLQADHGSYPQHLVSARTLLRPGGMLVARGVLPTGEHRLALTRFLHDLVEDPALSATVLPIDDGVALANRLPDPAPTEV